MSTVIKEKTLEPEAALYDALTVGKYPKQRVYICSRFSGNILQNAKNAKRYCKFAYENGYVPWAPHLYYPQFLNDKDKNQRAAGMRYGLDQMHQMSEVWVFCDRFDKDYKPRFSEGMKAEIELAKDLEIKIRFFYEDLEEV